MVHAKRMLSAHFTWYLVKLVTGCFPGVVCAWQAYSGVVLRTRRTRSPDAAEDAST